MAALWLMLLPLRRLIQVAGDGSAEDAKWLRAGGLRAVAAVDFDHRCVQVVIPNDSERLLSRSGAVRKWWGSQRSAT
jgi:hypothetical protein